MIRRGSSRPCCVVPGCSWLWFSKPSLCVFLGVFSRPFSWGFDGENLLEPFVVLWAVIPLPNSWVKGLNFGVFQVLGLEVFLGWISSIPLFWTSFGGIKLGYGLLMRCSYYPQSLVQVRGAIREIEVWIWGSWPAGAVHPELPRLHRSDRCSWLVWPVQPLVGFCSGERLGEVAVVLFWGCFEFGQFGSC
jgi:hypothetical protein